MSFLTRFYIMWRWIYKESKVPYDDAKKLAQSMVTLEEEWNKKFIIKMLEILESLDLTNTKLMNQKTRKN